MDVTRVSTYDEYDDDKEGSLPGSGSSWSSKEYPDSAGAPSPKAQMGSNHSMDAYLDDAEPPAPLSTLEKFKIEIACEKIRDFFHNIDGNPGQEIAGFDEKGKATLNEFDNQKSGDFGSVMFVCKVDDCTLTIKYQDPSLTFVNEVNVMRKINGDGRSPHLGPQIHDAFVCNFRGRVRGIIVMDELKECTRPRQKADVKKAVDLLYKEARILHMDVHGGNVMCANGQNVLVDFGLAIDVDDPYAVRNQWNDIDGQFGPSGLFGLAVRWGDEYGPDANTPVEGRQAAMSNLNKVYEHIAWSYMMLVINATKFEFREIEEDKRYFGESVEVTTGGPYDEPKMPMYNDRSSNPPPPPQEFLSTQKKGGRGFFPDDIAWIKYNTFVPRMRGDVDFLEGYKNHISS
jgi:hypothetical protein